VRPHGRAVSFVICGDREPEGVAVIFIDRQSQPDARARIRLWGIRIINGAIQGGRKNPAHGFGGFAPLRRGDHLDREGMAQRFDTKICVQQSQRQQPVQHRVDHIVGQRDAAQRGNDRGVRHGQEIALVGGDANQRLQPEKGPLRLRQPRELLGQIIAQRCARRRVRGWRDRDRQAQLRRPEIGFHERPRDTTDGEKS